MKRIWLSGTPLAILALAAIPASAQTVIGAKSGVINWVEGDAFLGDKPYVMQPSQFGEVKENMVFRTDEGRAEILLPPGVFLRLADKSSIKMISNRLIDTRVELLSGSGIVEVDDIAKEATVTIVVKDGTVSLNKAGLYRFDAQPAQLKVFKGDASVAMGGENTSVGTGKMLALSGVLASAEKFNVADTDSFDHWSRRRGELVANANISAAKQAQGYGGGYASNPCSGYGAGGPYGTGPFAKPLGSWGYNPYYGFGTYIPCSGRFMSPYGYAFWSPYSAYQAFWAPRPTYTWNPGNTGYSMPNYGAMSQSAGGYSGAVGAATSGVSSGASAGAASSMGASSAAAGAGASAGHGGGGAGGGGGHGK
jgi:hypothetical protein